MSLEKRFGLVSVSRNFLEDEKVCRAFFSEFYPYSIMNGSHPHFQNYYGTSPHFEEREEGSPIQRYDFTFCNDPEKGVILQSVTKFD